jgi:hypothetical protein
MLPRTRRIIVVDGKTEKRLRKVREPREPRISTAFRL